MQMIDQQSRNQSELESLNTRRSRTSIAPQCEHVDDLQTEGRGHGWFQDVLYSQILSLSQMQRLAPRARDWMQLHL